MKSEYDLERFLDAQATDYSRALSEIRNGRKQSHWMWYIFPQIAGLGLSDTAQFYSIKNRNEASDYLNHPVLGNRLIDISSALLRIDGKTANQILGSPDDLKLKSSMTLFSLLSDTDPVFQEVLDKFFDGQPDQRTIAILEKKQ